MIAICTRCRTTYNVDESRIQGGRVLLRCRVCGHRFSVSAKPEPTQSVDEFPKKPEKPDATDTPIEDEPKSQQSAVERHKTEPEPESPIEHEQPAEEIKPAYLKLLVADTPNQFRTRVVKTLNEIDPTLELVVVDDGGLAIGALAGFAPDLAIIGTAIEKVYCFEICDYIRTNDRLKDARIIFAAELHQAAWSCAEPESLYGADAWVSNSATDDELLAGLRNHLENIRTTHQQSAS